MPTKIKKMHTIYLVIEQGAGIVHKAFESITDATDFSIQLQKETGFDCYEVQPVRFEPTKLVTIQELVDKGQLPG